MIKRTREQRLHIVHAVSVEEVFMNHQAKAVTYTVVSCEPWPAQGIKSHSRIADYQWGYLLCYSNGQFEFDALRRPTDEEIIERWGIYFD